MNVIDIFLSKLINYGKPGSCDIKFTILSFYFNFVSWDCTLLLKRFVFVNDMSFYDFQSNHHSGLKRN